MNPTILIRSVAATLAAAAVLTAQSAPLPNARAPKAEAKATERMQVRLAEVIAMLEEDDLSPEQRAQAKKKLEEIVARLRETPAAAAVPSTPAPLGRQSRTAETTESAATPAPSPSRSRTFTFHSAEGGEGRVMLVPQEPSPPAPPAPPALPGKAPKPPKPPKAPKPEKGEVLEWVDVTHGEPGAEPKVLGLSGGKVTQLGGGKVLIEIPEGAEWAEVDKTLKAQGQHLRGLTVVQGEKARAEATEAAEKAERDAVRQHAQAARAEAEALRAQRAEVAAKRAAETRAKVDRAIAEVRERQPGEWKTAPQAAPESRVRMRSASPRDDDRDDAEIRQLIEEMRAEMREIRKLIQQMKQTQSAAGQQAGGQGHPLFGGAAGTAPAPSSTAPGVRRVRASGGGAGAGAGAGAGFGGGTSSNDPAGAEPVLIEVNGQPVESREQAVQTARGQYEAGARSFTTRWLDRGAVVERGYQALVR